MTPEEARRVPIYCPVDYDYLLARALPLIRAAMARRAG